MITTVVKSCQTYPGFLRSICPRPNCYHSEQGIEELIMQVNQHLLMRGDHARELAGLVNQVIYVGDNDSLAMYPPPCDCPDCQDGFYILEEQNMSRFCYIRQVSKHEAAHSLQKMKTQAEDDRLFLQRQCADHGDRIIVRWKKRSREKRQDWILRADPSLCRERWFLPRYTYTDHDWRDGRKHRKSFLLPYLSVYHLMSDPAIFLSLLHNRTFYPPSAWAAFDCKELTLGWATGYFEFCNECVIMYGPRYGEVTSWEAGSAHRSDILGFPRASLVLEAQANILRFLRNTVNEILQDADLGLVGGSLKWKEMVNTGFKKSKCSAYWSQFMYQPFSAPPRFDIHGLLATVKARMDGATDHLWLLQSDLSYMKRHLGLIRQNEIAKASNDPHPFLAVELNHNVRVAWFWQAVFDELSHIEKQYTQFESTIVPERPLPVSVDKMLGALELLLVNAMHKQSMHLQAILPQRPGFCQAWTMKPAGEGQYRMSRKDDTPDTELFTKDPLEWCLFQLQGAPDEQRRFSYAMLFDFLDEHLVTCTARDRARLDELLMMKLSEFATIAMLLTSVRLHRPRNSNRDIENVEQHDDRKAWRTVDKIPKGPLQVSPSTPSALRRLLSLPQLQGQRDRKWLDSFDANHEAPQSVWETIEDGWRDCLEISNFDPADTRELLVALSIWRSPEYLESIQSEHVRVLERVEKKTASVGQTAVSSVDNAGAAKTGVFEQLHSTDVDSYQQVRKDKVKARPQDGVAVDVEVESTERAIQPSKPRIVVKPNAFNILTAMFPAPADRNAMRTIDWDAFVHAMASAGLSATHHGGSAVAFEQDERGDGYGGKIIFHKPHPTPKIDPIVLRSMGKRMRKRFGWERDCFVLDSHPHAQ